MALMVLGMHISLFCGCKAWISFQSRYFISMVNVSDVQTPRLLISLPYALPLLLVLTADNFTVPPFEPLFEALIHGKCHCLAGCHPQDARCDSLVKGVHAFLFPHVTRDGTDPAPGCLPRCAGELLQARLDGVDGSVAQRTHGATHEPDEHRLPARQFAAAMVCRLQILQPRLQARVGREVHGLIRTLAEGSQ